MDLSDDHARARLRRHLGDLFRDRRVVCGVAPLAAMVPWVGLLEEAGARRPLLVAAGIGAGPVPDPEQADVVMVEMPRTRTMTEDLRQQDAFVRSLPEQARAAVDAYDPDGEAVWLVGPFIGPEPIDGRRVVGGRPPAWTALEDKLVADEVWDAADVPRAPYRVVEVGAAPMAAASAELDRGEGVVWAGDARDGFHGGGEFVRWVRDETERAAALAFFATRCDRVRVMPFLEGVPCSVHGVVLPDGTAAFRPVELSILRTGRRFVYGGLGTTWDPPAEDREQMRALVGRVGEHLRERAGYRGAFGVDGVLTADGFRPTELNARLSGGLANLARVVEPGLFTLLQVNLSVDRDPGVTAADLEAWALPRMDAHRFVRAVAMSPDNVAADPFEIHVTWDGERLHRSWGPTGWTVAVGPSAAGTYCRLDAPPEAVVGLRAGTLNVALTRFLDAELGTAFGDVTAPVDVRQAKRDGSPAPTRTTSG